MASSADRRLSIFRLLNCLGVSYSVGVIISLFLTNVFHCCPQLYGATECRLPILVGTYVVGSILVNLTFFTVMARRNRAAPQSAPPTSRHSTADPEMKFCRTCGFNVNRRCHHCPICRFCVINKDHHCFLTGSCVGAANQRYFVAFLFWATIGCTMGSWYLGSYLARFYKPVSLATLIFYFFPFAVVRFLFVHDLTIDQLLLLAQFAVGLMSTVGSAAFFAAQLLSVATGRPMMQLARRPTFPNDFTSVSQRFQAVFGPYWLLNFIIPTNFSNLKYCRIASDLFRIPLKEV